MKHFVFALTDFGTGELKMFSSLVTQDCRFVVAAMLDEITVPFAKESETYKDFQTALSKVSTPSELPSLFAEHGLKLKFIVI